MLVQQFTINYGQYMRVILLSKTGMNSFDLHFFRIISIVMIWFIPTAAFTKLKLALPYAN